MTPPTVPEDFVPAFFSLRFRSPIISTAAVACALALGACSGGGQPQMPPTEVGVITAVSAPVSVEEEYSAQTQAMDTVEVRARVSGMLDHQAYVDGTRVKQGDVLFVIDQQPFLAALAQAKADQAQAEANHVNSKKVVDRIRPLVEDEAISQQDLDAAVAKEAADAASVDAARAQVRTAELNLDYTTVRATRDGFVSKALVKPGSLVTATTTLLTTLYSVDPMYVNFTLGEQRWLDLKRRLGDANKVRSFAYRVKLADGSVYPAPGHLNFVDAAIDPQSGTLQMRLSVPNASGGLLSGQFVRVVVPTESRDMIRVPQQAVQEMQGKRSVLIVGADGNAAYREIDTYSRDGNDWLVQGGIQAGDVIIVEGTSKVHPGSPVKPVPAGQSANAAGQGAPAAASPGAPAVPPGSGVPPAVATPAPAKRAD